MTVIVVTARLLAARCRGRRDRQLWRRPIGPVRGSGGAHAGNQEQGGEVAVAFLRLQPDAPVEVAHDDDWDVEGQDGCHKGEVRIGLDEFDLALVGALHRASLVARVGEAGELGFRSLVSSSSRFDWVVCDQLVGYSHCGRPDCQRQDPGAGDHEAGVFRGSLGAIRERAGDGEVTIERDDEHVENGGVRVEIVHREPNVAHQGPF